MSNDVDNPAVDEDDVPGGGAYIELFLGLEASPGEEDARDAEGFPLNNYTFTWLSPEQLLAIARDLMGCDERGEDVRNVLQTWRRATLDGMLDESD